MKYYLIYATNNGGQTMAVVKIRGNKYSAIKEVRKSCPHSGFIPVLVKRISKKYYLFISELNKTEGGGQ